MEITVDNLSEGPIITPEEDTREQEHSWKCDKAHLKLIAPHDHYRTDSRIL